MKIGAQMYTVREFCKTTEGLAESLKKIADIGYTTVQLSGVCDYDPAWMKEQLAANGLVCACTHTKADRLLGETDAVSREHLAMDCRYVGLGGYHAFWQGDMQENYDQFLKLYKPVAKRFRENGLYFMYHNHDKEFCQLQGKTILRKMAEDFAPEELGFVLDTFWIQAGGASPVEYIREFKGRVPCIHLKDYGMTVDGKIMVPVGEGNINFAAVTEACRDAGAEYLLVEQDNCNGEDPFDCLKRSYMNLRALGLE